MLLYTYLTIYKYAIYKKYTFKLKIKYSILKCWFDNPHALK